MAQRPIREYDGKALFARNWAEFFGDKFRYAFQSSIVATGEELKKEATKYDWLNKLPLVAKPDMLFGKRGVNGLVLFKDQKPGDVSLAKAASWIDEKSNGVTTLKSGVSGMLDKYIVEPFCPHEQAQEYYIAATTGDDYDALFLSAHGGIEVEENWDKVSEVKIPVTATEDEIEELIKSGVPSDVADKELFGAFALRFYRFFRATHFAYLEINPIVLKGDEAHLLDLVARVDDTAGYMMGKYWGGELEYPTPFGMKDLSPEEKAIKSADEKSGASLKLTVLNPKGRIWTLVAGGGASVVYADTVADMGGVEELANYGEYSGNPTTDETYFYTSTVLDLMTREADAGGREKLLIIGGAIANFTDVAKTFDGIIKAFNDWHEKMKKVGVKIYVRRGGPNYEIGLKNIKNAADKLRLPIEVYGPEIHITDIVRMALKG